MEDGTWRDALRREREKLSKLTWKERFVYVWDYYKTQMVIIIGVILLIQIGFTMVSNMQKEEVLQAYFVNCNYSGIDQDAVIAEFGEYIGGLDRHEVVTLDTTITSGGADGMETTMAQQMKFTALMAAQSIDLMLLDENAYEQYEQQDYLMDLTDVFSEEQKERWSERLVEPDAAAADARSESAAETENAAADAQSESMTESGSEDAGADRNAAAVYAVEVTDSPVLAQYNAYFGQPVYAAVMANSIHADMSLRFIEYLLQE